MHLFSSKFKFIYTKLKLKTCHTKCLSFKMISVRWRPSSCMKFSSLFKNRPWHESTTDDRSDEFPGGWLPSNHSTYGACERKHVISNTTKEKKNHTLKDRESEGATARLRNGKWGARGNMFRTMVNDSFAVCTVAPSCWNHTLAQFILLRRIPPPGLPIEYYPFKRC